MMNKRGITLVEIIISVGLIAVVMLFLFNLLLDMQYEDSHASYLKENQVNRATIIRRVEEDLMHNELESVNLVTDTSSATITFHYTDFDRLLYVYNDRITYQDETWVIETNDNDEAYYDFDSIKIDRSSDTCSYTLNVDADGDGACDYNCDTNNNGVIDDAESSTINTTYQSCPTYKYVKIVIPAITGSKSNIIDDIEIFYIGLR